MTRARVEPTLFDGVGRKFAAGWQWWISELVGLLPAAVSKSQSAEIADVVVLTDVRGHIVHAEVTRRGRRAALHVRDPQSGEGLSDLKNLARDFPSATVALRLPHNAVFRRNVELPARAAAHAASILALELERVTPFRASDVYTAAMVSPSNGAAGGRTACQLIVKRSVADRAISELSAFGFAPIAMDCVSDGGEVQPVNFLAINAKAGSTHTPWRGFLMVTVVCATLVISAIGIANYRYGVALEAIESEVGNARAAAERMRSQRSEHAAAENDARAVRQLKQLRPSVVEIIDALTKILPDDVVINDLKIDRDTVDLSGMTTSAAGLVQLFERSTMFKEASLTAPVTSEAGIEKERISLRVKLRMPVSTASSAVSTSARDAGRP
jgi:general secretion pathway protein L